MTLTRRTLLGSVPVAAAAVALRAPPAYAAPRLRFPLLGSSVNGRLFTTLGRNEVDTTRVYLRALPAGSSWTNVDGQTDLRDGVNWTREGGTIWLSYKEPNVQRASNFFDTMPTSVVDKCRVFCTYHHEPENDFTSVSQRANYRAVWREHSAMIREHGMRPATNLMRYTLQPFSGRDWHDWWPGSEYVDFAGWDVYRKGQAGWSGNSPAQIALMMAPIEAVSDEVGKRWAIGETGSTSARYTDADTAIWAANFRDYILESNRSTIACWWDQDDFLLTSAVAAAWLG
jgi:hypothetical protein